MPQNFTQIQQALDTKILTVSGITTANLFTENETINFAMQPDITSKLAVRTTLIPTKTITETLGTAGYVSVNGIYAVDVMGAVNQGFTAVSLLADSVLAAFAHGSQLTLTNGDVITISSASPSPNTNQGAWTMNKLYCRQVIVEWFGFIQP
jgi:hypothetical protein